MSVQLLLQKSIAKAGCESQYVLCIYCERAGNSNQSDEYMYTPLISFIQLWDMQNCADGL